METPPVIEPNSRSGLPPVKPANLARCGLYLSFVAPLVALGFLIVPPG
jgi:hypothetical protein